MNLLLYLTVFTFSSINTASSASIAGQVLGLPSLPTPAQFALVVYRNCLRLNGVNGNKLVIRPDPLTSNAGETPGSYPYFDHQWNHCCGFKAPIAFLVVNSIKEIQAGVSCGRLTKLRIVPKGGGHSYGKYSFGDNDTVVIDLRNLDQISIDRTTAVPTANIGPGALMAQINYNLYNNGGYGIPFGACQTVGMGYGLGGGFSEISRLMGMNVDALIEVKIVNSWGLVLTANAKSNPDLFWAIRGGGAGSFGIVAQFKYKLFNAPPSVVTGQQIYAFSDFVAVFNAWQNFIRSNPPNNVNAIIRIIPTSANIIQLTINQFQSTASGDTSQVQAMLGTFPNTTLGPATVKVYTYLKFIVEAGNAETGYNINITDPSELLTLNRYSFNPTNSLYAKTFYAPKYIDNPADIQRIYDLLNVRPDNIIIVLRILGGKIATVAPTDTAFVHRGQNLYEEDILYIGPEDSVVQNSAKSWMYQYYNETKAILDHKESFQNHLDTELIDYLDRYYGQNLPRLIRVKDAYDWDNFFYNPQSVPTSRLYRYNNGFPWLTLGK